MSLSYKKFFLFVLPVFMLLSACAHVSLTQVWSSKTNKKTYKKLLVIGVSNSQQTRRIFEKYFVSALGRRGVQAIESYKLMSADTSINRESVSKAIKGLGIDGVLVTYLIVINKESVYKPATDYMPVYSNGYSGGLYSYYSQVYNYVHIPTHSITHKQVELETNLYDVNSEEPVWSAHSHIFASQSVDEVIPDLTKLVIADLDEKHLIINKK